MTRTSEKAAVPRLRFKGREGAWTRQPIGELFSERDERSAEGELLSVTIRHGVVRACDSGKADSSSADKSHYKVVKIRDLAYNSMRMWQGACGASKFDGIVSPAYTVIVPNAESDSEFFEYTFKRPEVLRQFQRNSQGMTSDTWNLKFPLLKDICISCPEQNTQVRIASAFRNFDKLILLESSHLTSLRQLKRATLVKMFPRPGQCVPEIRFKGFEGEWEVDFASRIFQTVNIRNRAELPVLSANQERGMIFRNDGGMQITHDRSSEKMYKLVSPGDFVIHLRSFQGGFAHSTITGIASPAYTIMHFRDDSMQDDFFWRYVFTSKDFVKRLELITYGIRDGRSINFSEFSEMSLMFPSLPEQRKIAAFFRNLDRLIRAAEKKVAKLRQVKASLLERMFV